MHAPDRKVTHIGFVVVEHADLQVAVQVARAADFTQRDHGTVTVNGTAVRWISGEQFARHGGFESQAVAS